MKNIHSKLLILIVGTMLLYHCSDDDDRFIASTALEPALLEVQVPDDLVLDPQFSSTTIINFSWQEANYNQPTEINYSLEMSGSADFLEPVAVASTTQLSIALTVSQLNNAAGDAGLTPFETGTIYARITSAIGSNSSLEQVSNVISFDVFPYTTEKPRLYVVGNYQSDSGYGTVNAEAPTLASSEFGSETDYEGFVYFGASTNEYTLHRAGFVGEYVEGNPIYGNQDGLATEGVSTPFTVESPGFYLMRVNLETFVVSLQETTWGIAGPGGPAGDWPSDTVDDADMEYDIENRFWIWTGPATGTGPFKFRANDDWGLNLGIDGDDDGSLDFGGQGNDFQNNLGASRFVLDLSSPRAYTFSISN